MSPTAVGGAAIYTKEAAGYPDGENSKELQFLHCGEFCKAHDFEIIVRYHDSVCNRADFDYLMDEATQDTPTVDFIVVYRLATSHGLLKKQSSAGTVSEPATSASSRRRKARPETRPRLSPGTPNTDASQDGIRRKNT